jgi:hypothetical protein
MNIYKVEGEGKRVGQLRVFSLLVRHAESLLS